MRKAIYPERPLDNEEVRSTGIMTLVIRFNIHEIESGWECEEVEYNHTEPVTEEKDYGPIVSTLIRAYYSQDQVEAITQNYLAYPEEHKQEFDNLQSWRSEAKRIARLAITQEEENK